MMRLTEKQQAAVDIKGNIIVSAAAGSGKTRVMTERIIKLIAGGADIRDMAVMTYTSTAAAEMKSRIYRSLIARGGENEHMRLQADLVPSARIGTCHSFCGNILRENYELAGLSYNFTVINEEVTGVLQKRAAIDTITDLINGGDNDTLELLKHYSKRLDKSKFYDSIQGIVFNTRASYTDPDGWLDYCESITPEDYAVIMGCDEGIKEGYERTFCYVRSLVRLTREIRKCYAEYKAELNGVDFDDMLLKACAVLEQKDISFKFVFVDEFQDTNPVQKKMIELISRNSTAFYVGDRKQCIFEFNDAEPRIFSDTADSFRNGEGTCLSMNENFRSSRELIDAVNFTMECAMNEAVGGIVYDDEEKLIARSDNSGEVRLLLNDSKGEYAQTEVIADKIRSIIGKKIWVDNAEKEVEYGDIAILTRKNDSIQPIGECLHERNIPYITNYKTGLPSICAGFLVNMLKALEGTDNDLAVLDLMKYRGVGFTDDELARVRVGHKKGSFTSAIDSYIRNHDVQSDPLARKLFDFKERIDRMRAYFSAYSLEGSLFRLAEEFSLFDYAKIKSGAEFEAVINLIDAISMCGERTLTGIVQYLESRKDEQSKAYAFLSSDKRPDSVTIMSIHKSKGLEFPIVFIANMEKGFVTKKFNTDNYFLYDKEYGIVPVYRDIKRHRNNQSTVIRDACIEKKKAAMVSEEIRILYVAMTRAKCRLYMCATVGFNGITEQADLIGSLNAARKEDRPYNRLLDYVLDAYASDYEKAVSLIPLEIPEKKGSAGDSEAVSSASLDDVPIGKKRDWIVFDRKGIAPAKISVSALKKMWSEKVVYRPHLFEQDESVTGADFGTMIHILMQKCVPDGDPEVILEDMRKSRLISEEEAETAREFIPEIKRFLGSRLAQRIKSSGMVLKEVPFSLEIDASGIGVDTGVFGEGTTLLQGVIDLAFKENGEWVVVDYKTDRVRDDNRKALIDEYSLQTDYYSKALEEITGIKVSARYLAFLRTGETVTV